MSRTRFLVAKGPTQLLAGLTVWAWEEAITLRAEGEVESIILLGDFFAGPTTTRLDSVCRHMAPPNQGWQVISTHEMDARFYEGAISFERYLDQLREAVRRPWVDEALVSATCSCSTRPSSTPFPARAKSGTGTGWE
jgi:hypothetical protein